MQYDVGRSRTLLSFGGASYLTGTLIADAVLVAGLALARRREMDVVSIPFLDGVNVLEVEFTIGWMSDIVAVAHIGPEDELLDDEGLARLRAVAGVLGRPVMPVEDPDFATNHWADYDHRDLSD